MPALAGEPPFGLARIAAAGENEAPGSGAIETARVDVPHLQPIGEAPAEDAGGAAPPTAESEQGVPYVSETERVLETVAAASELAPEPPHPIETVTEKPANPRRGWWQRLIQS